MQALQFGGQHTRRVADHPGGRLPCLFKLLERSDLWIQKATAVQSFDWLLVLRPSYVETSCWTQVPYLSLQFAKLNKVSSSPASGRPLMFDSRTSDQSCSMSWFLDPVESRLVRVLLNSWNRKQKNTWRNKSELTVPNYTVIKWIQNFRKKQGLPSGMLFNDNFDRYVNCKIY